MEHLNNKKPDYIIGEEKNKQRIVIDNKIRHGKPIIKGTRITIDEVLGALVGGMTYEEIEREYGIRREDILAVLEYTASFVRGEEIRPLRIKHEVLS